MWERPKSDLIAAVSLTDLCSITLNTDQGGICFSMIQYPIWPVVYLVAWSIKKAVVGGNGGLQVILIDNKDGRTVREVIWRIFDRNLYRNILDKDDKKVVCVTVTLTCSNLTQFTCWHAVCSRTVRIIAEMFLFGGENSWERAPGKAEKVLGHKLANWSRVWRWNIADERKL